LTIKGERKAEEEKRGKNFRRVERSCGRFEWALSMPDNIDDAKIKADFDKGVLTIEIRKRALPKSKVKKAAIKTK
jgi:HSP20 family protein